ncbi:MAG: putative lipid II flippase FtsW [Gammaproteobacteria bacterium]|nr:putative lipid II flippase FtsW [Gammaproteobacteria bacterium]
MSALVESFMQSAKPVSQQNVIANQLDMKLLCVALLILCIGLVMVESASITTADRTLESPFYYLKRQLISACIGLGAAYFITKIRLLYWEKSGLLLLGMAMILLLVVLIPGVGKTVNGSMRWIPVGLFNLQVSEVAKLFLLIYTAGYLVRHGSEVQQTLWGFLKPMLLVSLACLLLLLEPDFGATVVVMLTVMGMMYLGGVRFTQFSALIVSFAAAASLIVIISPYRMQRLTAFVNPWADPFDSGFQLTQSLIAIGRGSWSGTGLGGSVQKLFYLPEAHTDFIFAVYAEETGLIGVCLLIFLFTMLVYRAFMNGREAEKLGNRFAAFTAYGIGIWLGLQAFINIGVNMGVLPTKGLTLPLMSYGGSSLIVNCVAIGLLLRISIENAQYGKQALNRSKAGSTV